MNRSKLIVSVLAGLFICLTSASRAEDLDSPRRIISLDGSGWQLGGMQPGEGEKAEIHLDGARGKYLTATSVPNNVQLAIGLKDPYSQDKELAEINRKEWWYVRSFPSPKLSAPQRVRLVFEGVDYFADVWLNGQKLGAHEGAFTGFGFDITDKLKSPANYLAVRVTSPWKVPGRSHYEFMKGEYEEQWDGMPGPGQTTFPLGLHRSVRLEVTAPARIEELQVATLALKSDRAELKITGLVTNSGTPRQCRLQLTLQPENFSGSALEQPSQAISFSGKPGESQAIELSAAVDHPRLWWTWDTGPQNLYRARATLFDSAGVALDSLSVVFGIRTIERDTNVRYSLNGRPIFLRGAWYPLSRLYPAEPDRWSYEKDLLLARHANMNHLVNFTVVEKKDFYDLADRMGMLLFVEMPFNQLGPLDSLDPKNPRKDEYLKWCSAEVGQIVRALANHPSVAVWCPVAETTTNGQDFTTSWDFRLVEAAEGYEEYVKTMEGVARANDPDSLYFRSFCDFGEKHFWDGGLGGIYDQHFENATTFVSEYGGMAFFPWESIRKIIDPDQIWNDKHRPWSALNLPVDLGKLSYLTGFSYGGLAMNAEYVYMHADQHLRSLKEFTDVTQIYQDFVYGYAADSFRRRLGNPINGIRSWSFKDFAEKPICSFGVIDPYHTPLPSFYTQKRTFEPVTMSYAVRYVLESVPAGARWTVPVWISNATDESVSGRVESALFSLRGDRLQFHEANASVPSAKALSVCELNWRLPEEPGIYLVRGRFGNDKGTLARAEMYVKVVPRVTRKPLRVLVLGTPDWARTVRDYLSNLGADVAAIIYEPTVVRAPAVPFPASAEELRSNYDVIWLTGFNNYWREAPESWSETIVKAVEAGTTFVHSGGWGSFHGGEDDKTAALDLTPLARILPVEVQAENDVYATYALSWTGTGGLTKPPQVSLPPDRIRATTNAPGWLKTVDFSNLSLNYHMLKTRPDAQVLLTVNERPLLVKGRYGKGDVIAYLGFSPGVSARAKDYNPVILDRVLLTSAEHLLFADISASLLALASKEDPALPIAELLKARTTPLFESLKNTSKPAWPELSVSWLQTEGESLRARVRVQNGRDYVRKLRLRFDGPDFAGGRVLALWSNQYFDLLPNETGECTVEIRKADQQPLQKTMLVAETLQGSDSKSYPVPAP